MIDYEALETTRRGRRFDRIVAALIGVVAVLAAMLAFVQASQSLTQSRDQAQSRRLASDLTTRISVSSTLMDFGVVNQQRALLVIIEGIAHSQTALTSSDPADSLIGQALVNAGTSLQPTAKEMGEAPPADTSLDPYAAEVLRSATNGMQALLAVQRAVTDAGDVASTHGSQSVMGLSLVALAGVFTGLAAVVGSSRTGRALLFLAVTCTAGATALLVLASGIVG